MMKMASWKKISLVTLGLMLLIGFNNCSGQHNNRGNGGADLFSTNSACEDQLIQTYQKTMYPFLSSDATCKKCHVEGGVGIGTFASSNIQSSYLSFKGIGWSKISYQATNEGHKAPWTGLQNQPSIDALNSSWPAAETDYMACVAKSEGGGSNDSLLTAQKAAPSIYSGRTEETLTWDLDSVEDLDPTSAHHAPGILTIRVKVLYDNENNVIGYTLSAPTLTLKTDKIQMVVEGLYIYINGQLVASQTTFAGISKILLGTSQFVLLNASGNVFTQPVSTSDKFSVYFRRIVPTSESNDIPPATPILSLSDPDTNSGKFLRSTRSIASIFRDAGIVRWCLTDSAVPPVSTEVECPGQGGVANTVNGWFVNRPNQYFVPTGDGLKSTYLWVANGSLKINITPAKYDITLDATAPSAPTITNIVTPTTMQVTDIAITDDSTSTNWCIKEQNSITNAPGLPSLNDDCWRWSYDGTKPNTVGFKAGGTRRVWAWTRDEAGNISTPSAPVTVALPSNLAGITFSDLTRSTTGLLTSDPAYQQAVFTVNCYRCHGLAGEPGHVRLRLFEYAEALRVADNGLLVSRTNNPLSPMPNVNSGLMNKRYRDLIRLWLMPENGNDPAP